MNLTAIARAISLLKSHASIASVVAVAEDVYMVAVRVPLPSRFRPQGSPSGVQAVEEVQLQFLASFPLTAPRLTLRPDFNPNLPHINPFRKGDRVPPCLLAGDLDAFHSQMGLLPVIDQLVAWLAKAGSGDLIDPEQGWEPSRRDSLGSIYEIDQDTVRNAPPASNEYQYWDVALVRDAQFPLCAQFRGPLSKGPRSMYETLTQNPCRTFGVVAMCDNTVASTYLPESVDTLGELAAQASSVGCGSSFEEALRKLRRGETPKRLGNRPIVVLLICRRPFPLIGSTSSLEMIGYVLGPGWLDANPACEVVAAGHRQPISIRLLREVSGFASVAKQSRWSLLGAGSLGSKIGLHLARAGLGPAEIYDNGVMEPHNFARHGLCPTTPYAGKANGLCLETQMMGQAEVRSDVASILAILTGAEGKAFDEGIDFLVNTTGSMAVREGLAAALPNVRVPRVIEASLLAGGKLGLMTTEGNQRNPSTMDLSCISYRVMAEQKGMSAKVFTRGAFALGIGQGCSSPTMIMSDATISSYAAPMSTRLSRSLSASPPGGEIILWQSGSDGLSLNVEVLSVGLFRVVKAENAPSTVRLSPSVVDSIVGEIQGAQVEKGGILLGRFSEASGDFHVVDCLPAPPDSDSGPDYFILGIEGVRSSLEAYENKLNGALYCVGTWHSHPGSAKASKVDRLTAEDMRLFEPLRPMVMVIASETSKWSALRID